MAGGAAPFCVSSHLNCGYASWRPKPDTIEQVKCREPLHSHQDSGWPRCILGFTVDCKLSRACRDPRPQRSLAAAPLLSPRGGAGPTARRDSVALASSKTLNSASRATGLAAIAAICCGELGSSTRRRAGRRGSVQVVGSALFSLLRLTSRPSSGQLFEPCALPSASARRRWRSNRGAAGAASKADEAATFSSKTGIPALGRPVSDPRCAAGGACSPCSRRVGPRSESGARCSASPSSRSSPFSRFFRMRFAVRRRKAASS
jgi:hypothetical protein